MKGNRMSAILAILLMLGGVVVVPVAFAGPYPPKGSPPSAVVANVGSTVVTSPPFNLEKDVSYPAVQPGYQFTAYIDVINVTGLFSFECGFTFNNTVIQINSVDDGGFLSSKGAQYASFSTGDLTYSNATGDVPYSGGAIKGSQLNKAAWGSGHLLKVGFCINPSLWPPYSGTFPGSAVSLMHFNTSADCDYTLKLCYNATGTPNITPPANQIYDGQFKLYVTPHHPTPSLTITPATVIIGTPQKFNASGSAPGWDGVANVSIDWYYFDFGDGNTLNQSTPVATHTYTAIGTYIASVTVHAGITGTGSITHPATVLPTFPSVSILPISVVMDLGQSQLFTSSVSGGAWPFSYQWYLNGGAVSGAISSTWTFIPSTSGSDSVYLNITDSASQRAKSNTAPVTVHSAPSVSILPTSATLTVGHSQKFTSTASGGTPPYSYQWYRNGSAVSGATSSNWTFAPASTGIYEIYVNTTDAVNAVAQSNTAQLKVNPPPVVAVTISQSKSVIEVGQSVFFNSTVTGGASPYTYQWYLNGTAVAGASHPTWTFIPSSAGTYSVFLKAIDFLGIVGESSNATVFVNPPLGASVSPSSVVLDIGEPWTFIANAFDGIPPYLSYQWYLDGSPVINATSATWTYTPFVLADRTVYVTVTDSAGITCRSNPVSVTVSSAMSPTISPLSVVMDIGQSHHFVASVSGGTPPYSYQWYQWFPDGSRPFAGANTATFDFTPSLAGFNLIYVEITDSLGAKVDIGAGAIVNPLLTVSISPSSVTIDVGQSQTFTSSVSGGTSPYSYQWYVNGTAVTGANSSAWMFKPLSAGAYEIYVNATDSLGMSAVSNIALMVANPPMTIILSPESVALDIGKPWTFIASTYNGTSPYSHYQWYIDGSPIVGANSTTWTYTPLSLITRTVYVTAEDSAGFECTSNPVTVTVSAAMNPTIYPVSVTLDVGQSQTYTASVSGGTPPYSYQWYQWFPTGCEPFIGATNPTFDFTPPIGFNIIYVVITDSHGVKVTWGATANVNPPLSVSISPTPVEMDIGMSQTFTSVVANGTQPYTYQWYIDGTLVVGATMDTWTYTPTPSSVGDHTVYLSVTDAVNSTMHSNDALITVNPLLTVHIFPTSATTDLGLSVSYTSSVTGGMTPYGYEWYVNGDPTGATGTTFTIMPISTGTYLVSLVVTDAFGFTASDTGSVTINPDPTVNVTPTAASIQLGHNATFTATVMYGTPPYYYRWYIDGGLTAQTTIPTYAFTPPSIDRYYQLSVAITDACGVDATSNTAIINGHDIEATAVVPTDSAHVYWASKTIFDQGYPMGINVSVTNVGYYTETFNVTVYMNATAVALQSVTLASGQSTTIILASNNTNLSYGHYIISAGALPVPGEVNTANNYIANSVRVTVTIPGDVNGDGKVDVSDLNPIAYYWGKTVPPAPANADIDGSGRIDVSDLNPVGWNWGKMVNL